MLQTQDLAYQYAQGPDLHFPNLQCDSGSHWLILGQSGTGKTTLLHLLAGLLNPSTGSIQLDGQQLRDLSSAQKDRFRGQNIGLVFQRAHFLQALSVTDNLLAAQYLAGVAQDSGTAQSLLDQLDIGHTARKKPHQLSQGEQQRLSIARALINKPSLILADEPTSSLDDQNTQKVLELLTSSARETKSTLLIVTHDQRLKTEFDQHVAL